MLQLHVAETHWEKLGYCDYGKLAIQLGSRKTFTPTPRHDWTFRGIHHVCSSNLPKQQLSLHTYVRINTKSKISFP